MPMPPESHACDSLRETRSAAELPMSSPFHLHSVLVYYMHILDAQGPLPCSTQLLDQMLNESDSTEAVAHGLL